MWRDDNIPQITSIGHKNKPFKEWVIVVTKLGNEKISNIVKIMKTAISGAKKSVIFIDIT
ncbi:MAG: hypothetical protein LN561_00200 [Rickettsia endosymbiont of Labidopullus appendiculatus]|nr:hypothetical protein [Rickettsia endosymbiont of Labidopullus appendiculatus]